ncbi:glycosyltransferase [Rhizobium sp. SG2393]|uniref:glycosyltransferase n=1 Tax=Rhizobium sp. SG2393 TaxID=3276279 RepID=UPI00366E9FA3
MRIAFFFWSLELGGVEHMITNLSRELVNRGHDITIVLARDPQPNEYTPDPRVKVIRLGIPSTGKLIWKFAQHLRAAKYDLVYTAMPTTNVAAIIALKLSGAKTRLVISERSNPALEAQHSKTWRYRASFTLQPFLYPRADAIVAVCKALADELAEYARLPRERIRVIYNPAFDEDAFAEPQAETHPWLDDKTVPVIISAGRLAIQKDYGTLLRAFALLRKKRPARLLILGEGPQRTELEALIAELGIKDDVDLPGFRNNISAYLSKADIFALSSIWEGFGNVLVQALAARCSIVTTDCRNGPGEIVDGGKYGALVPVGDAEAFAAALDRVLDNPFDPDAQFERAQLFSVRRSSDTYENLFDTLVRKSA